MVIQFIVGPTSDPFGKNVETTWVTMGNSNKISQRSNVDSTWSSLDSITV